AWPGRPAWRRLLRPTGLAVNPTVSFRTAWAAVFLLSLAWGIAPAVGGEPADLTVFTREGCPHCAAAAPFLDRLTAERPDIRVVVKDVGRDRDALLELQTLAARKGIATPGVPA